MSFESKIQELLDKRVEAKKGGGEKRIATQHAKGKLTARERIELLLDENYYLLNHQQSYYRHQRLLHHFQLTIDNFYVEHFPFPILLSLIFLFDC